MIVALCAVTTLPAISAAQSTGETDGVVEEILVTGSHVRQNPLEVRSPIQTFTRDDFQQSGDVSFYEFLQRIPANGSSINRTNNTSGNVSVPADGSGAAAGEMQVDLRYLEAKRTLVLVDGRRWVRGSSASGVSGAVDLNTIPQGAIKSVEVLLDGASAIYGSDAIGGVVNIITRDDYEGFRTAAYYSAFDGGGGGDSYSFDISVGASSDKGRLLLTANYIDSEGVLSSERSITQYPIPGYPGGLSTYTPQGAYFFTNNLGNSSNVVLNEGVANSGASNGGLPVYDPANPASGDFHAWGNPADRYNWQPPNSALIDSQVLSTLLKAEYDLNERVVAKFMASFANRQSRSQAAPEPLGIGPTAGFSSFVRNIVIPADQEYNPFGIQFGGDGGYAISMFLRPEEAGPRIFKQNVDTWHFYSGLEGTFEVGEHEWYWQLNAGWFQSDAGQQKFNGFNARNMAVAAGPADACAAIPGCVPLNLFGGRGGMTREMLDFVTFVQKDESRQEMFDSSVTVSGSLLELPAGPVGVAAGLVYREEKGSFVPDAAVLRGETAVSPTNAAEGQFDVTEYFAEIVVPLVSDFDISGAVRGSDYSLFGSTSVFSTGMRWSPADTFTLRANYAEGFRAPNIGELFNIVTESPSPLYDLCSGATGEIASNCQTLGVPPGFVTVVPQFPVASGGNRNLEPEESESMTAGFTWDASRLMADHSLLVSLNYYDTQVDNAVNSVNPQIVLNQCIITLAPQYCNLVERDSSGLVTHIDARINNIAGIETDGIDLQVNYSTPEYSFGQLQFDWITNFLLGYTERTLDPDGGVVSTSREGTEIGEVGRGFPEVKSTLAARLVRDRWSAGATVSYISELTERCGGLTASYAFLPGVLDLCDNPGVPFGPEGTNTIDDRTYLDLQATFRPSWADDRTEFSLGMQNVTDEDPPVCRSCRIATYNGQLYRFPGRLFYLRASYNSD